MRTLTLLAVLALPWTAACDDKNNDDDDDTGGGGATAPAEGHWTTASAVTSDPCGLSEGDTGFDPEGGYTLTMTGATTFTVQLDDPDEDGWDTMQCSLAGTAFTCDPHSDENPIESFDATIVATQEVSGTFPTWTTMEGTVVVTVDCTGDDCETISAYSGMDFPCVANIAMTGQADG